MKIEIQNCLTWLVNEVAKAVVYNWDNEYKATENKESFNIFYEELKKHIDFTKITQAEATELRFGKWDTESNLYLFPLYLVPIIPEGLEVTTISGNKIKYERNKMDNDIRFGCVAYGIEIND